jgi:adenylyltransferase/sulfurtransferase
MRPPPADPPSVAAPSSLSREELVRYARHLVLGEVGRDGQERLKAARVLLVGAGGLGSPAGLYLAAAGVGTLGVVDADRVDLSNLQRQILHGDADLGRPKVDSARERMLGVNPHVAVRTHRERLTSANALDLLADYDLVVDGSDNFPTRYLVNDAGVLTGTPVAYGAILRWEGQVSLFATPEGPCYRCLFREPPPPGLVPDCAQAGVFGALPGVVGSMQAIEALKWILGVGDSLAGRLLLFDALAASWREVRVRRNPECPVCGDEPTQTGLIDYERFCGVMPEDVLAAELEALAGVSAETRGGTTTPFPRTLEARELAALLEGDEPPLIVDVREAWEWEVDNLAARGSVHVPLERVPERLDELPTDRPLVMVCRVGSRSAQAALWLRESGHPAVANLRGGLMAWAAQVDPGLTVA